MNKKELLTSSHLVIFQHCSLRREQIITVAPRDSFWWLASLFGDVYFIRKAKLAVVGRLYLSPHRGIRLPTFLWWECLKPRGEGSQLRSWLRNLSLLEFLLKSHRAGEISTAARHALSREPAWSPLQHARWALPGVTSGIELGVGLEHCWMWPKELKKGEK